MSEEQEKQPIWDGNKIEMICEKLETDLYAFYDKNAKDLNQKGGAAATSGGLIVGEKGSLLIETYLNKRIYDQVHDITQTLSNGKPILYAVNTSCHGDHWYGNMYLPQSTLIIQHNNAKEYIDGHLDEDKKFMIGSFGKGRGIEEIAPRTGDILVEKGSKIRIDLGGGKIVEIMDFGFAQTGGDLWIWEPRSKILWAGNPVIASKPSLPWLLDGHLIDTLETMKRVYEFLPQEARIIPGHGVMVNREDLRWSIDYLSAVQSHVQKAINEGLNLEQTVKKVNEEMGDYRGYVIYDWVHSGVNVPKAFQELSIK